MKTSKSITKQLNNNALIYVRVSLDNKDYKRQCEDLERFCKENNYNICDRIEEKITGFKKNRDFIKDLIEYFEKNPHINNLIVQEFSRIGRTYEVSHIVENLANIGICTISIFDKIKTLNADGSKNTDDMEKMGYAATRSLAEINRLKARLKDGIASKARSGYWHGGKFVPYGYKLTGVAKKQHLIIDEENEAKIVRMMFSMMQNSQGTNKICSWLNSNNIPSKNGGLWGTQVVRTLLKNPIYMGQMVQTGIIINVPPIVDENTYNAVNEVYKHTKKGKHTVNNYLINTKLIYCGVCKTKHYYPDFRSDKSRNSYKCLSNKTKSIGIQPTCNNHAINIDKLNNIALYSIIYDESNRKKIESELNKNGVTPKIQAIEQDLIQLEKELKTLDSNELNIMKKVSKLSDKIFDQYIDEINSDRAKVKSEIQSKKTEINQLLKLKNEYKDLIQLFKSKDNAQLLKENINKIITKIVISPLELKNPENKQEKASMISIYTANNTTPLKYFITRYSKVVIEVKNDSVLNSIHFLKAIRSFNKNNIKALESYNDDKMKVISNFNEYFKA